MSMSLNDRIALEIGRPTFRALVAEAQVEQLQAKLAELEPKTGDAEPTAEATAEAKPKKRLRRSR